MIAEINPAIAAAERRVKLSTYGAVSPQIALSEAPNSMAPVPRTIFASDCSGSKVWQEFRRVIGLNRDLGGVVKYCESNS
jgi:hypothetical protein